MYVNQFFAHIFLFLSQYQTKTEYETKPNPQFQKYQREFERVKDKKEQQETFFIKDPHGNILELKTLKNA